MERKGLCYLAAIKARTLPLFEWSHNITLKHLVNLTKYFRRNDQFYVTKHGNGQYHLDLQKPQDSKKEYAQGDWKLLEFMAERSQKLKLVLRMMKPLKSSMVQIGMNGNSAFAHSYKPKDFGM